jgi:hypothetical protein
VPRGLIDLIEGCGVDAIQHARDDGAHRLPHEDVDRRRRWSVPRIAGTGESTSAS